MWTDYLYLSERRAKDYGFTHHGTIFGVPCWIKPGEETLVACPKITLLQFYALFMDKVLDFAANIIPEDWELSTPHSVGRPISGGFDA